MRRRFSAPVISAALSGFVIGVFVTLLALGVLTHPMPAPTAAPATLPPATPASRTSVDHAVAAIARKVLGPSYPNPARARVLSVHLLPVDPDLPFGTVRHRHLSYEHYVSAVIEFRLNDHPLGPAWRARAARADVFEVMRALYTSRLPIYNVELVGKFPLKPKSSSLQQALIAFLSHTTAATLPWKRMKRTDESKLWSLLTYHYVNPRFGKLP